MKNVLLISTVALLLAVPVRSQDLNRDSVPTVNVYKNADEIPFFPGGVDGFHRFVEKNFIVPAEVWRNGGGNGSKLRFIIRRDGVACGLKRDGMPLPLYEEWKRLFSIMPLWTPAMIKGYPVDVEYSLFVSLYDRKTGFPFHIVRLMKDLGNYDDPNKEYRKGINEEEAEELVTKVSEIVNITPENGRVTSLLIRLYVSLGKNDEVIPFAKESVEKVRDLGIKKRNIDKNRPWFIAKGAEIRTPSNYDSKLYMNVALAYALACDVAGSKEQKEKAYEYALNVVDERIFLKDIKKTKNDYKNETYRRLMAEKQILAASSTSPGVTLNSSERSAIFNHGWVSSETMRTIDRNIEEGKIDNPRIRQINTHLKEMDEERRKNPPIKRDTLYLYGLRAMAIDLSEGQEALNRYVDSMQQRENVGSELKSYLSKLAENRRKHAAVLNDREAVVRSLAGYAPINAEGDSKVAQKQRAKEFYKYRDAMKAVYPLKWLWKQ